MTFAFFKGPFVVSGKKGLCSPLLYYMLLRRVVIRYLHICLLLRIIITIVIVFLHYGPKNN